MLMETSTPEKVVLEIPSDAWKTILDYVYSNLEWDDDSPEKQKVLDALDQIRKHIPNNDAD